MAEFIGNYESLIRKVRGSAGDGTSGAGNAGEASGAKVIRYFCVRCEHEFIEPAFNKCTECGGAIDAIYDLDQVQIPAEKQGPDPLQHYFSLLPVRERSSLHWGGEGNTPCFEVSELASALGIARLYFKNEAVNPTSSTKDRVASVCLSRFGELGVRDLVLSSTGNSSTAYARAVSLVPGFTLHIFVGREFVNRLNYADHPRIVTHVVDGEFVTAGRVGERFAQDNGFFWEGGFFNLGRREGLKLAYLEAYDEMQAEPDYVFQAVSSGMGLVGAYKGAVEYRELGRLGKVPSFMAVQQASCSPMAQAFAEDADQIAPRHVVRDPKGLAYAILRGDPTGTYPYIRDLCLTSGGRILAAGEERIRHARRVLAETVGVDVCFASSTAFAGVLEAAEAGLLASDSVVLVNLTGADRPAAQVATIGRTHA